MAGTCAQVHCEWGELRCGPMAARSAGWRGRPVRFANSFKFIHVFEFTGDLIDCRLCLACLPDNGLPEFARACQFVACLRARAFFEARVFFTLVGYIILTNGNCFVNYASHVLRIN